MNGLIRRQNRGSRREDSETKDGTKIGDSHREKDASSAGRKKGDGNAPKYVWTASAHVPSHTHTHTHSDV